MCDMKFSRVAMLFVLGFGLIAVSATAVGAQDGELELSCSFTYTEDANELVVLVDMPVAPAGTRLAMNFERGVRPNEEFSFIGRTDRTSAETVFAFTPADEVLDGPWSLKARYVLADGTKSERVDCGVFDAANPAQPMLTCNATLVPGTHTVRLTGTLTNKPLGSSVVVNLTGDDGYVGLSRIADAVFDTQFDLSDQASGDWSMQARWRVDNDSRGDRITCGSFTLGGDDGSDLQSGPADLACWADYNVLVGAAEPEDWTVSITGTVDRRTARFNLRAEGSWLYTWQFGGTNISSVRPDTLVVSGTDVNGSYECSGDWLSADASGHLTGNVGPEISMRGVEVDAEFDGAVLYTKKRQLGDGFCFRYCSFSTGPFFIDGAGNDVEPTVVSPLPAGSDLVSTGGQFCSGQIVIVNFTYREDVFQANGIANLGTFTVAGIGNGEQIRVLDVDCEGGTLTWEDVQNGGPAQVFDLTTLS